MQILIKLLKAFKLSVHNVIFDKVAIALSLGSLNCIQTLRIKRKFNNKVDKLVMRVCSHPNTYKSSGWGGGYLKCSVCHKTLEVLWLPKVHKSETK